MTDKIDIMIRSILCTTPEINSPELSILTISKCMSDRLDSANSQVSEIDKVLSSIVINSQDDATRMMKVLKESNKLINNSDRTFNQIIVKLLNE